MTGTRAWWVAGRSCLSSERGYIYPDYYLLTFAQQASEKPCTQYTITLPIQNCDSASGKADAKPLPSVHSATSSMCCAAERHDSALRSRGPIGTALSALTVLM